jgi:zona occludens toxin (predicted ATPase)
VVARASKVAKTGDTASSKGRKGLNKKAKVRFFLCYLLGLWAFMWFNLQATMSHEGFMSNAPKIYVNLTHTPPPTDADGAPSTVDDLGFLGNLVLVPTSFSTGSYGWKTSKKLTIELEDSQGGSEKEKLQVILK